MTATTIPADRHSARRTALEHLDGAAALITAHPADQRAALAPAMALLALGYGMALTDEADPRWAEQQAARDMAIARLRELGDPDSLALAALAAGLTALGDAVTFAAYDDEEIDAEPRAHLTAAIDLERQVSDPTQAAWTGALLGAIHAVLSVRL